MENVGRDIYIRHTAGDGKSVVREHRVWDADRLLASEQAACDKMNEAEKDPALRKASVQQITQEQYTKERVK